MEHRLSFYYGPRSIDYGLQNYSLLKLLTGFAMAALMA